MEGTITETQRVLADMLTENTGTNMLDSGGAYGRNWERNQGRKVEDYLEAPDITIHEWSDGEFGYVTVDVFHFLDARVEYNAELTEEFNEYADQPENRDVGWLGLMEEWAEGRADDGQISTFNSYNAETLLSQTIQGTGFPIDGQWYVLLQIHGGCDVRGGYTAPKVFAIRRGDMGDVYDLMWGWNSFYLTAGDDRWSLSMGDWIDMQTGELTDEPDTDNIVKGEDGEWVWKPTGAKVEVWADNDW